MITDRTTSGPRVVSLVPSATETLVAWGTTPIACTRFCERPDLVHVGGTKDPDVAAIVELAPDLVVMDAEENRIEDHDALRAAGVEVHALHVRDLADLDAQLPDLASRLGATWTPVLDAIPAGPIQDDTVPDGARRPIRAFVPIWKRPWMALGAPTYGTSLLDALGVLNVLAPDGPYPETTLEDAAALDPDVVLAPDEPYPFAERHRELLESVAPVVFVDGRDLLWWGTRSAGALERLAALLSPRRRAG